MLLRESQSQQWLRTRIEDRVATRAEGREGLSGINRSTSGIPFISWSSKNLWPLTAHEHAREPIGVESPDKGLRFDGRSTRRPKLEQHLTAKRQPLVDEDFCPGRTSIFGPPLELPRPARNGDEPRHGLAREPPSVLFAVPHSSLPHRYGHFSASGLRRPLREWRAVSSAE